MLSTSHAIALWLSVWRCVAVRRCEGSKIGVSAGIQQIGVKSAKEVEGEGKQDKKLECWRARK